MLLPCENRRGEHKIHRYLKYNQIGTRGRNRFGCAAKRSQQLPLIIFHCQHVLSEIVIFCKIAPRNVSQVFLRRRRAQSGNVSNTQQVSVMKILVPYWHNSIVIFCKIAPICFRPCFFRKERAQRGKNSNTQSFSVKECCMVYYCSNVYIWYIY